MSFRILLEKENFKFSCSHFTIFGPQEAEALHGHNYYVSAEFKLSELDPKLGLAFDFNLLKPLIKKLTDEFDEHVLIPKNSPYLKITETQDSVTIEHGATKYQLPKKDALMLDAVNITSEELARTFAEKLKKEIASLKRITTITVGIQETRGQTVFYDTNL